MCDFDVTRLPVTPAPFLSRDALVLDDVAGLLVELSEVVLSVESFKTLSLLFSLDSFKFEVVLEDFGSQSAVGTSVSCSVVSCVCTIGSSFTGEGEGVLLISSAVSVASVATGSGASSSLV